MPGIDKVGRAAAVRPRPYGWRRPLRVLLRLLLLAIVACACFIGALFWKHGSIVGAGPGTLRPPVQPGEAGRLVNPFIGTGGFPWVCGNNFPGAMVPFGMLRLGPETASLLLHSRALNTSGYYYGDAQLLGFSHTRLNGTGATDGGHFLVIPTVEPLTAAAWQPGLSTPFSHSAETASPGYYAVNLPKPGVLAELTATPRVGLHRYTFRGPATPHILIDVSNALGGRGSSEATVRVIPELREVEGSVRTFGTFAGRYGGLKVCFVARFNKPFATSTTLPGHPPNPSAAAKGHVMADLGFEHSAHDSLITLSLAISHVSIANARENLQTEAGDRPFDELLATAQKAWEERLSLVKIQGGTQRQRTIFLTALYRAFQMPTAFNDANGDYIGFDRQIHRATGFRYFTDLSLWDTFRTTHPLYTLIAPDDQRDMVVSLIKMLEQGGWLPRWPSGHGYSNSMLGTPADIVIAESYLKGLRGFDVEKAFEAMRRTALAPTPPGARFSGREGVDHYLTHHYCPAGLMDESVSRTFEFGWSDSAISLLAGALGRPQEAALFLEHSHYYRNLWNTNTQYFQPRDPHGTFVQPFEPLLLTYLDWGGKLTRDYVEGSPLQWRWGAPYDAAGMIALFKSRDSFISELEKFFARSSPAIGAWNPGPYYWHGNQPDIHAAYLFNPAGRPDLTRKWARWIMDNKYGDGYDGLDGNDDGGTLSAWYVWSALGLYPVAGSDKYELGTPLFERAEIRLKGKPLVILAENFAPNRSAVSKIQLNDTPLNRTWIRHAEIEQGGTLRFTMSSAGHTP